MGQSVRQNVSFAASGVARLSSEGRGPFDVAGERFHVTTDEGVEVTDARLWLGGVDITDAIVTQVDYEFGMELINPPSMGTPFETSVPGRQSVRVTVELALPGEFKVRERSEDEWQGPLLLDQKELL